MKKIKMEWGGHHFSHSASEEASSLAEKLIEGKEENFAAILGCEVESLRWQFFIATEDGMRTAPQEGQKDYSKDSIYLGVFEVWYNPVFLEVKAPPGKNFLVSRSESAMWGIPSYEGEYNDQAVICTDVRVYLV